MLKCSFILSRDVLLVLGLQCIRMRVTSFYLQ